MSSGNLTARGRIQGIETSLVEEKAVAEVYSKHAEYIRLNVELDKGHLNKLLEYGVITKREFDSLHRKSDTEALNELLHVLPRKGPHGFMVFVSEILMGDLRYVGEFLELRFHDEIHMSQVMHTRSNEDVESHTDEHQRQINRIFSNMTALNYREFSCETPEPATLDKIEDKSNLMLKTIEDCCKQFDSQPTQESLKHAIIDLKHDRDIISYKSKNQIRALELKLRNEKNRNEKLETKVKELEDWKSVYGGHSTLKEMAQELREMKQKMEGVIFELEKEKDEKKQLSRTLERTLAELDTYKEKATKAENELDKCKLRATKLEKEKVELSIKLKTDATSNATNDKRPSTKQNRTTKGKKKHQSQRKKHS